MNKEVGGGRAAKPDSAFRQVRNAPAPEELGAAVRCDFRVSASRPMQACGGGPAYGRRSAGRRHCASNPSRISNLLRRFSQLEPRVTVQEWIEGGEESLQIFGSCTPDHEVKAFFTARKRLQYPPLAGTGIVVEALPLPNSNNLDALCCVRSASVASPKSNSSVTSGTDVST